MIALLTRSTLWAVCLAAALFARPVAVSADTALVAVAANFADAAADLAARFATETGHEVTITTGSTGKLYAQIVAGAPFDVLLAADAETPARLEAEGMAMAGTRFTYAVGQLALWSADATRIGPDGAQALEDEGLRFVAIANPALAPYGKAARAVMMALGQWDRLQPKLVLGQNIGQTHALVATGAAEVGFVALSAITAPGKPASGSFWPVPAALHDPIRQDAVLLMAGRDNAAAAEFLRFVQSEAAAGVIAAYGYGGAAE
jgi:molybdate transport system substrate-binding protein